MGNSKLLLKAFLQTAALFAVFKAAFIIIQHYHHLAASAVWIVLLLVVAFSAQLGSRFV